MSTSQFGFLDAQRAWTRSDPRPKPLDVSYQYMQQHYANTDATATDTANGHDNAKGTHAQLVQPDRGVLLRNLPGRKSLHAALASRLT